MLHRYVLSIGIATALLAGCGGSQPPIGAPFSLSAARPGGERARTVSSYSVLYNFSGGADGAFPMAGLVSVDGTLYGTTQEGGLQLCPERRRFSCGTVFAITTSGGETVLYRFKGRKKDGSKPYASLVDVDGTLYGTTNSGGTSKDGTVYSITPSGAETALHSFNSVSGDGSNPFAGLTNVDGTLYGTTASGGASGCDFMGCGTVFSVSASGKESVLYKFGASGDGSQPIAGLINVNGTLYGTTFLGGTGGPCNASNANCGTVFSITTSGEERVLHSFTGAPDGANPYAGLIHVGGKLYGTTTTGGMGGACDFGCGTVFSMTTSGKEHVLYSFKGSGDGRYPSGGLVNVNGTLYGTTYQGGGGGSCTYSCGTVFSITTSGKERVLHSFTGEPDGANPNASLVDVGGTLYGTTMSGGTGGSCSYFSSDGCGTAFSLTP